MSSLRPCVAEKFACRVRAPSHLSAYAAREDVHPAAMNLQACCLCFGSSWLDMALGFGFGLGGDVPIYVG